VGYYASPFVVNCLVGAQKPFLPAVDSALVEAECQKVEVAFVSDQVEAGFVLESTYHLHDLLLPLLQNLSEFQRTGLGLRSQLHQVKLVLSIHDDDFIVAEGDQHTLNCKIETLRRADFLGCGINEGEPLNALKLRQNGDLFVIIDKFKRHSSFFFFEMGQYVTMGVPFTEIFEHEDRISLGRRSQGVQNVVVQNHVLEIFEAGDVFVLAEAIDDFLNFGQHIIEQNLFAEGIDDFVVIDGLGAGECG
jgi:hypothetical protein